MLDLRFWIEDLGFGILQEQIKQKNKTNWIRSNKAH